MDENRSDPAPGGRAAAGLRRRDAVRVVVRHAGTLLLLPTTDPVRPWRTPWLELPGGGLEPGESAREAAVRELHEELGWRLDQRQLRESGWRRSVVYPRATEWVWQDERILLLDLGQPPASWSDAHRTETERTAHAAPVWRALDDLRDDDRYFPASLPGVLPRVLSGEPVVESVTRFW